MIGIGLTMFLLVFVGFFVLLFFGIRSDMRDRKVKEQEDKEKADKFIAEQNKLPKYRVSVETSDRTYKTQTFDPRVFTWSFLTSDEMITSEDEAKKFISRVIKSGAVTVEEKTIPVSEIKSMQVEVGT